MSCSWFCFLRQLLGQIRMSRNLLTVSLKHPVFAKKWLLWPNEKCCNWTIPTDEIKLLFTFIMHVQIKHLSKQLVLRMPAIREYTTCIDQSLLSK